MSKRADRGMGMDVDAEGAIPMVTEVIYEGASTHRTCGRLDRIIRTRCVRWEGRRVCRARGEGRNDGGRRWNDGWHDEQRST